MDEDLSRSLVRDLSRRVAALALICSSGQNTGGVTRSAIPGHTDPQDPDLAKASPMKFAVGAQASCAHKARCNDGLLFLQLRQELRYLTRFVLNPIGCLFYRPANLVDSLKQL